MNPLQRLVDYGQKRFNEMLFPGSGGGWDWTYNGHTHYGPNMSEIVFPGVTDWSVDVRASSAVAACVNWFCRTFPEAPLQVVQTNRDGEREVVEGHPLPALLEMPNPFYSGVLLWDATLSDWMIDGNAYWVKVRNRQGALLQLWWTPSSLIEPRWNKDDATEFIGYYEYQADPSRDKKIKLDPSDVVHFRYGIDPANMRKGKSPLASVLREIFTDEEAARYSAALLKNMGVPGVLISPDSDGLTGGITQADAEIIKEQFRRKTTGDKRGEPVVMSAGVKVSTLSFNPTEMNLKDLRRVPEERVTAVLGIPAIVAGLGAGLDRSTYSNMAEAREAAYESFIIPHQRRFAADIKSQLLADFGGEGQAVQFDTSGVRVLQEDENARAARWVSLLNGGVVMLSEARNAIGLPVEPEHDVFLRPVNLVEVGPGAEPAPEVLVENAPPALPAPQKALEPEYKAYGGTVIRLERQAQRETEAYLREQYEKAAASGRGWQSAMDLGPEARSLWNKYYPLIVRRSWDDTGAELGTTLAFDLENERVRDVLDELAKQIVGVAETTRQEVRDLVGKQAAEGWSIDELAAKIRELKETHSAERARLIARTETAAAYSMGSYAGYREAGVESVEWLTTDPCPVCAENDGKIIPLGETFPSGHLHPPGHPACRCSIAPVIGED
jgi:HK97 family phage portal protein